MARIELFYNLVSRDALAIYRGVAHTLEGPYASREEAERAAADLIGQVEMAGAVGHDDMTVGDTKLTGTDSPTSSLS